MKIDVGANIKSLRNEQGLSQRKLEQMAGLQQATICKYEAGRAVPRNTTLDKIAEALNVDVSALYEEPKNTGVDEIKAELIRIDQNLKNEHLPNELTAYFIGKREALDWAVRTLEREVTNE